jgi:type IV secretory pathway VirB4 component
MLESIFGKPKTKARSKDNLNDDLEIEESNEVKNIDDFLDNTSLQAVYPFSWEEFPDHIESGSNYIRVLTIVAYPKEKSGNWLSDLKRKKGNITIVQNLESSNAQQMIEYYDNAIKNKEAELLNTHDPLKKKKLEKAIDVAEMQMNKYLDSEATYLYQSMYVFLQGNSLDELNALTDSVENTLRKLQLQPINTVKAQYHAFWSALPISENLLRDYAYQQSNTEVASSTFPFDDGEVLNLSPYADIEGVNKDTDSLIAIDYSDKRNVLNQNQVVIGTSGVGKTTYMKQKILKYIAKGTKVFIIDPENEYTDIVERFGGEVVHLSSNANTKINPLEIFSENIEATDNQSVNMEILVKDKIQRIKGFFQVLKPDLSQVEKAIIDTILQDVYRNSGILKYTDIDEISHKQWPILADVYQQIEKLKSSNSDTDQERFDRIKDFYFILDSYVNGSNTLFNGTTNIDVKTDLLSFDLKALQNEQDIQGAAYLNTFSYLWDEITKNKTENIKLFVDEFHFLTQNTDASTFFYQAYKRFRKYNAGAIAGTQQIQDVLDGTMDNGKNVGQAIVGNSYTKIFFGLDNRGLEDVEEKLRMDFSEKERRLISKRVQGEALIINGSERALMKVELSDEELRLIDPQQYEEKFANKELIDYEAKIKMTPVEEEEARTFQY